MLNAIHKNIRGRFYFWGHIKGTIFLIIFNKQTNHFDLYPKVILGIVYYSPFLSMHRTDEACQIFSSKTMSLKLLGGF